MVKVSKHMVRPGDGQAKLVATMKILVAILSCMLSACTLSTSQRAGHQPTVVAVDGQKTIVRTYLSRKVTDRPVLLVVLHGDTAPWNRSAVQNTFAERIAEQVDNVVAVGMVRPGYIDAGGFQSDGIQGEGIGDNYNAPRVDQMAAAISDLATRYNARATVLVGDSGGAAVSANLIARHPDLVDAAVLNVCPCDVRAWRESMYRLTGKADVFQTEIDVLSPIDSVAQVSEDTAITVIAGASDKVVPSSLVRSYYDALVGAGKTAQWVLVDGGHDIFLSPEVIGATIAVVAF